MTLQLISTCFTAILVILFFIDIILRQYIIKALENRIKEQNQVLYDTHKYCLGKIMLDALHEDRQDYETASRCQDLLNQLEKK